MVELLLMITNICVKLINQTRQPVQMENYQKIETWACETLPVYNHCYHQYPINLVYSDALLCHFRRHPLNATALPHYNILNLLHMVVAAMAAAAAAAAATV